MFSWLFGSGNKEEQTKEVKAIAKPAQKWVSDGKGGYLKHGESSTHAALTSAMTASLAPTMVSDDPFPDDDSPSMPTVNSDDALGAYQEILARRAKELQALLERWKQKKIEVISGETSLQTYDEQSTLAHPSRTLLPTLHDFFTKLFHAIRWDLESADQELHGVLDDAHRQVQDLCDHLEVACESIKSGTLDESEHRKTCIDMCNLSIEIINELIVLTQNIQSELEYCLHCESITEQIAKQLVQMAILVIVKVPLPGLSLNFNDSYRHFLYNEIKGEKEEIDLFETDIRGQLAYAMKMINEHEVKPLPSPTVSKASLFTASKELSVLEQQPEQEMRASLANSH